MCIRDRIYGLYVLCTQDRLFKNCWSLIHIRMDPKLVAVDSIDKILNTPELFNGMVEKLFAIIDKDKSGGLDLNEMEEFITSSSSSMGMTTPPSKESIKEMFEKLDVNKDKILSKEELSVFVKNMLEEQKKALGA
eukprot:TRINITY_DN609_c0_g1_i5.p1 TRINITY_DN609_c0_g1~~TRINITY_DN609_c0_g1_i5.p1  ORF type:complete len:135 (+),score=39.17 TRINITY_DN609_c0_g1_i5:76-480(+)